MSARDPDFLTVEDVLLLHEEQLAEFGGGAGIRDLGALHSATAMPQATFDGRFVHGDAFFMAAAYAFHIAQGHPFLDGNKRTGLAAALVFLDLNGIEVADPEGRLYGAILAVAEGRLKKAELAALLRELAGG